MYSQRLGVSHPYSALLNLLRVFWIGVVGHGEIWTFSQHVGRCRWPDTALYSEHDSSDSLLGIKHMLLVADPQILDEQSYPGRSPWLVWLTRLLVDLNMRKSWRAALALHPNAVVFLGDMMDNGRMDQSDDGYEEYFQRFRRIFRTSQQVPMYYISGNHDVGLGTSPRFSEHALGRYTSHFGLLNQIFEFGNHTFVLIDAPGLVAEEDMRHRSGYSYSHWADLSPNGVIAFVQSLGDREYAKARVLLTHIPLARPEGAPCGPLRERGTIRQGKGFGYQNTLAAATTEFILQRVQPSFVFSGDDHDYCTYTHTYDSSAADDAPSAGTVKEVTVKSFSMAMGIRQPGFQLLSIGAPPSRFAPSLATVPCLLPDQLGIYLNVYLPLFLFSVVLLLASNVHRVWTRDKYVSWVALPRWCQCQCLRAPWCMLFGRRVILRLPLSERPYEDYDVELGNEGSRRAVWGRSDARRGRGVLAGLSMDLMNTAWMPLVLFVGLAWWVS
ncbi:Metallo-dependent phosphatase [Daedalea quercina L-15889]|uniref:Metallo-dependent phosphatase n=1 Tax=Daedalea quercina L-15889 TaxID=1314783 RepID=A0A165NMV7_9APHY|nr:Metallo-dependent phosphatase [Daedalea quercina L-15889]